jgi:hypothetical protein
MAEISWERNYNKNYDLSNPKTFNILIGILLALSIILSGVSLYSYLSTSSFLKNAKTAEGTVVKLLPVEDAENNSITYKPVFEFKDQNGKSYVVESGTSSDPPAFKKGEKVEIFYDPASPGNAKINSFFSLWGITLIFGAVGVFFLLFAALFLFIKKRVI